MRAENIQGCLGMGAQVVSKRETQGKRGAIFTVRFTGSQPAYKGDNIVREEDFKLMGANKLGPDLFFELWDFSDTQQELDPA